MPKKNQIFGLVVILFGLAGIAVGLSLLFNQITYQRAAPEEKPQAVRMSNLSPTSVTISWVTDEPTLASVSYSLESEFTSPLIAFDDRGQNIFSSLHHISLIDLKPGTTYYLRLNSAGQYYDDQGQPYTLTTPGHISQVTMPDFTLDGQVKEPSLVYFTFDDSTLLSAFTDKDGHYLFSLTEALNQNLNSFYLVELNQIGHLLFQNNQTSWAQPISIQQRITTVAPVALAEKAAGQKPAVFQPNLPSAEKTKPTFIRQLTDKLRQPFRDRSQDYAPTEVKVANVTDSSLSITWVTETPARGSVILSTQNNRFLRFLEFLSCRYFAFKCLFFTDQISNPSTTHFVSLNNLQPNTAYFYRIVSGTRFWKHDQEGRILPPIKTVSVLEETALPHPIFGPVYETDGETPVSHALVYLNLIDGENQNIIKAQPLITYTDKNGVWQIDLGEFRSFDFQSPASPEPDDLLFIKIWDRQGRRTSEFIPLTSIEALPTITMP